VVLSLLLALLAVIALAGPAGAQVPGGAGPDRPIPGTLQCTTAYSFVVGSPIPCPTLSSVQPTNFFGGWSLGWGPVARGIAEQGAWQQMYDYAWSRGVYCKRLSTDFVEHAWGTEATMAAVCY
jgi:hypothetical protein